ncbi:hypothetical protein HUN92_10825 [Bacillus firmus]|uniref:hypothetical protein n=2 Tax=Cytobacillus firmus TaxID=1399 RepID=UPI0015812C40|nr:hypothetical protein [Cytobacillus firmus]MBG9653870.1 hypothetical protein [Cytobacillus firmus]MED1908673.1 hypothetical protein [Cytobacillus firmus]NUH84215.1 hypothetical protein [Cytobacillus firmus]
MNIQHYYLKTADISLNASLTALMPPFFFLLLFLNKFPGANFIIILFPFIIYSFLCHQMYLLNKQRAAEAAASNFYSNGQAPLPMLQQSSVLIAFLPAPSLRMVIFDTEGRRIGEIRDMKMRKLRWFLPYFIDRFFPKRLGIYDHTENLEASIIICKRGIEILSSDARCRELIEFKKDGTTLLFQNGDMRYAVPKSFLHTDLQVLNEQSHRIARLRKGWMPFEWGKRFTDPNTPVLTFNVSLAAKEKRRIYAMFAAIFLYRNH